MPRNALLVIAIMGGLLIVAGQEIVRLQGRPAVSDRVVTRTVRGPVRMVVKTVTAADGTKTVEKTLDRGVVTIDRAAEHVETPVLARPRTRYAGLGVNPLDYTRQWRGRGGMTVFGALDAGVAVDLDPARLKFDRPMVELTYRF